MEHREVNMAAKTRMSVFLFTNSDDDMKDYGIFEETMKTGKAREWYKEDKAND